MYCSSKCHSENGVQLFFHSRSAILRTESNCSSILEVPFQERSPIVLPFSKCHSENGVQLFFHSRSATSRTESNCSSILEVPLRERSPIVLPFSKCHSENRVQLFFHSRSATSSYSIISPKSLSKQLSQLLNLALRFRLYP